MSNNVFSLEEIHEITSIPLENLLSWEKEKLLVPLGKGEEQGGFFSREQMDQAVQIHKLGELGYGLEEIQRIIRKVGLPNGKGGSSPGKGSQFLTVGHLAEKIGTSPRTIKHWEEKGIIEPDMRSQGGFRLYGEQYVYLCQLIKDLQLFGYSLEEIKSISDYFRLFIKLKDNPDQGDPGENETEFVRMLEEIDALFEKIRLFREGMARWEDLARKKKKEIVNLRIRNQKRIEKGEEK